MSLHWHKPVKDELARVKESALNWVDNTHPSHHFISSVFSLDCSFINIPAHCVVSCVFIEIPGVAFWRVPDRKPQLPGSYMHSYSFPGNHGKVLQAEESERILSCPWIIIHKSILFVYHDGVAPYNLFN